MDEREVPAALFEQLTARQHEVLALVAKGATNAEIAAALGVSLDGAKWHLREIFARLGVDSREEAAEAWRRHRSLAARTRRGAHALLGWTAMKAVAASTGVAGIAAGGIVVALAVAGGGGAGNALPPASATATPGMAAYIVAAGDTCAGIAAKSGITAGALQAANPVLDPNCTNLVVGMPLRIPSGADPLAPGYAAMQSAIAAGSPPLTPVPAATATPVASPPPAPGASAAAVLQFNLADPASPFRDRRIRRALLEGVPGMTITPADDPEFAAPLAFDPDDAQRQLVAAGMPAVAVEVTLLVPDTFSGAPIQATAAALQAAWQALGVTVHIEVAYAATFMARVNGGTYQVALLQ